MSRDRGAPVVAEPREVVSAEGLEVRYHGPQPAVAGVDLTLAPGGGLLVAGAEAAGKTSLLRGLLGLTPAGGRVRVLAEPPGRPAALRRVGYGPQGQGFAGGLAAGELVRVVARLRGASDPGATARAALERAGLGGAERLRGSALGLEDARRLSLALAIAGEPALLVLDDPWEFPETVAEIELARERGGAVIVASRDGAALAPFLGRTLLLVDGVPAG